MGRYRSLPYSRTPWLHRIEHIALRYWWVVLFLLLTSMVYERAMKRQYEDYATLNLQWEQLQTQRRLALDKRMRLQRERASKGDPAYIELLLLQELGLVPQGQVKVLFDPMLYPGP